MSIGSAIQKYVFFFHWSPYASGWHTTWTVEASDLADAQDKFRVANGTVPVIDLIHIEVYQRVEKGSE